MSRHPECVINLRGAPVVDAGVLFRRKVVGEEEDSRESSVIQVDRETDHHVRVIDTWQTRAQLEQSGGRETGRGAWGK